MAGTIPELPDNPSQEQMVRAVRTLNQSARGSTNDDYAVPFAYTQYNGSSYAMDIRNLDTSTSLALRARANGGVVFTVNKTGISLTGSTFLTALTAGSIPFIGASGLVTQDTAHLFYDDATDRLGVGTATPLITVDVVGAGIGIRSASGSKLGFFLEPDGSGNLATLNSGGTTVSTLDQSTGNLAITPVWASGSQTGLNVNVTDSGAAAGSALIDGQIGGTSRWRADKTGGMITNLGTLTTNIPVLNSTVTWNNAAQTFAAFQLAVTDTASAAASTLLNVFVGGVSQFQVNKAGLITTTGQIAFPATQNPSADANTLDDYEEGTWTPNVGGNATYSAQTGTYTKIGRTVYVNLSITINVIGTGSTTTVSGLPFTPARTAALTISAWVSAATALVSLNCNVNTSGNIVMHGVTVAAVTSTASPAVFASGTTVTAAGWYEV